MLSFSNILFPLLSIAVFGFSGSLHCIGMCSPLVATCKQKSWKYFFSRSLSYTFIGIIAGFLGVIFFKKALNFSGQTLAWIVVLICLVQIYFTLQNFKKKSPNKFTQYIFRLSQMSPFSYPTTMGIMTALLPCGFLYSALLMSSTFASPLLGALSMFVFSLVTSPALISSKLFFHFVFLKNPNIGKFITITLLLGSAFFALKRGGIFAEKGCDTIIMCHGKY